MKKDPLLFLKISAFLIFMGRGYQYLFFDAPFRALLWDESLLQPLVEGWFNTSWNDYVTNLGVDLWIQRSIKLNGIIFMVAAVSSLLITSKNRKFFKVPILVGGIFLVILSFLSMKEHFYHYAQFFEHSIQFGVPFLLIYSLGKKGETNRTGLVLKILIALTFTSHGLYALGIYPIPGYFTDMTINSLGVTENTAIIFLTVVGILDILLSIAVFFPSVTRYVLMYAIFWGISTALARVIGNFNMDLIGLSIHHTFYKVAFRLPHGLIPLLLLLIEFRFFNRIENNITNPKIKLL